MTFHKKTVAVVGQGYRVVGIDLDVLNTSTNPLLETHNRLSGNLAESL